MIENNEPNNATEVVVLLHGIFRSKYDMIPLENFLKRHGFSTLNISYPSRKKSLESLAAFLHDSIKNNPVCQHSSRIHFVTHSMGGLVVRYYVEIYKPSKLGKVVMFAPPNSGSEFADWLSDNRLFSRLYKILYGPAGEQLKTLYEHIDGPITYSLGIIAGNRSYVPITNFILPGEHDGTVPVARTTLHGQQDHIVLPITHTFIMFSKIVMQQTLHFLQHGKFQHIKK